MAWPAPRALPDSLGILHFRLWAKPRPTRTCRSWTRWNFSQDFLHKTCSWCEEFYSLGCFSKLPLRCLRPHRKKYLAIRPLLQHAKTYNEKVNKLTASLPHLPWDNQVYILKHLSPQRFVGWFGTGLSAILQLEIL